MQSQSPKPLKNFLSVIVGAVVRDMRVQLGLSYKDIQSRTKIKGSYFQNFEQGNAILHVNRAHDLYQIFRWSYPHCLAGFLEVLSLISLVEEGGVEARDRSKEQSPIDKNKRYYWGLIERSKSIAESHRGYERLHLRLARGITDTINTNEDLQKRIIQFDLKLDVKQYIIDYNKYLLNFAELGYNSNNSILERVGTFHLDFVTGLAGSLSRIGTEPSSINKLLEWEYQHRVRIREFTLISTSDFYEHFTDENLPFSFIFKEQFEQGNFLSYSDRNYDIIAFGETFGERLGEVYNLHWKDSIYLDQLKVQWDGVKNKLRFINLNSSKIISQLLATVKMDTLLEYDTLFLYRMIDDTYAGAFGTFHAYPNLHKKYSSREIVPLSVKELNQVLVPLSEVLEHINTL